MHLARNGAKECPDLVQSSGHCYESRRPNPEHEKCCMTSIALQAHWPSFASWKPHSRMYSRSRIVIKLDGSISKKAGVGAAQRETSQVTACYQACQTRLSAKVRMMAARRQLEYDAVGSYAGHRDGLA